MNNISLSVNNMITFDTEIKFLSKFKPVCQLPVDVNRIWASLFPAPPDAALMRPGQTYNHPNHSADVATTVATMPVSGNHGSNHAGEYEPFGRAGNHGSNHAGEYQPFGRAGNHGSIHAGEYVPGAQPGFR